MKTQIITLLWCCFSMFGFSQSITNMEYFLNTDPGFGNATPVSVNANTGNLTQTVSIPVGNTQIGFNTLYIRVKDNLGVWSLYDRSIFYIKDIAVSNGATNIIAAEYFLNNDPGFGNATAITVNTNAGDLTQSIDIQLTNNLDGFNTLYIRIKDNNNVWSLYDRSIFYVTKPMAAVAEITLAEYFYDTDPGFGNGTPLTLVSASSKNASTKAVNNDFTVDLSTSQIACGTHNFYIRLQNADGTWSIYDYGKDVEVYDNANPTIVVFPNITAELDASGQASVTIADVDNGTYDDCELTSVVLNQPQIDYTCANLGANTVKITATDAESKVSTQDITVTVVDRIAPVAKTQNITVQLGSSGQATITPSQIENGSTDNCAVTGFSLDVSSFTCTNIGANTVNLTVTDSSGNSNTSSATVTVEDIINPVAIGQDITRDLIGTPSVTITASDVDNGSSDNCNFTLSIDMDTFTAKGVYQVVLTATDNAGNMNAVTVSVTIIDISLGIDDYEISAKNINLYPVPTDDYINISTKLIIESLSIYNLNGKLLRKIEAPSNKINISQLSAGIYFLKFNVAHVLINKQIIKK